jgi:hypothetical protein
MKLVGVKALRQIFEKAICVFGGSADQGVTDDHAKLAVHAPVDEEAEALIAKPFQALGLIE